MSTAQLHPTQPLLRALLDTTPPVEYREGSFPVSNIQHDINKQRNMPIINRANMLPPNQQTVSIYQSIRTDNQVSSFCQRYPNNAFNESRYQPGVELGVQENITQQTYTQNFSAAGPNDNQGLPMMRNYAVSETILPDIVDYNDQNNWTPTQPRQQAGLQPLNANYSFEMSSNVSGIAAEPWNRSNSLNSSIQPQEHAGVRRLFPLRKRNFLPPAATSTFRDSGGFIISNTYERERNNYFSNNDNVIYYNAMYANQAYDLSLPKPSTSQPPPPRGAGLFNMLPPNNTSYSYRQPSFVGSDYDVPYTQTKAKAQGHRAQETPFFESGSQAYAPHVPAGVPPPAYQSPRDLRNSQQSIVGNSSKTTRPPVLVQFNPTESIPSCLEYMYNYRRDLSNAIPDARGGIQCERPPSATSTTTTNCHRHPKISARASESHSGSEATESSPEADDPESSELEGNSSSLNVANINNWSVPSPIASSHYAEARAQSLLSLPHLYQMFEPQTEVQVGEQLPAMNTPNTEYLGKLTPNASSTPMANAQLLELVPPTQPNPPNVAPSAITGIANTTGRQYINDTGLMRCQNSTNGCQQIYPGQQMKFHEQGCLYMVVTCPLDFCAWKGKLGGLADHICDVGGHKHALFYGEKQAFVFDWSQQCDGSSVHFIQLCGRRLFVVTVAFRGPQIYVFLQEIATYSAENTRPPCAMGYLEIAGKDGFPYSWNGQIAPVQSSLMELMIAGQCLNMHVGDIASTGNGATLYEMVTP